jgi:ADP-heptose:LPS heptosyltransferase
MSNQGMEWKQDVVPPKNKVPVSSSKLREMGIKKDQMIVVNKIEDLRESPPGIIIAEAVKTVGFMQNWFKKQQLVKKKKYVMGLGVYQQLHTTNIPGRKPKKVLKPAKTKFINSYRPYTGQSLEGKTLLVFRTGGIGDLLFIKPNLNYLKSKYNCTIKFACGPQYQSMVETWDCVDEMLDLPFEAHHLYKSDYHMLFEGVIERCREAETTNAYNLFSKWIGLDLPDKLLVPHQEPKIEMIDECMKTLEKWNLQDDSFILMQLRASSPVRTPRPSFWVETINQLTEKGHNIILTDNPRQAENIEKFIKDVKHPEKVFNFCQYSKSLDHSIAITKFAKMTLTTDSAFSHIAASLNVPCFGVFGPFPGYIRLKTYPRAAWVDAQRECAPCYLHSHKPCPKAGKDGFSPCYDNIDIPDMINKIEDFLNG